jgi:hypothetical protein
MDWLQRREVGPIQFFQFKGLTFGVKNNIIICINRCPSTAFIFLQLKTHLAGFIIGPCHVQQIILFYYWCILHVIEFVHVELYTNGVKMRCKVKDIYNAIFL